MWLDMKKILLVDDDVSFATAVQYRLVADEYEVDVAYAPTIGFERLAKCVYDVILLDWQLPEMSGLQFLKTYRARAGTSYVIMLTVLAGSGNKAQGLIAGADDYLPKPFDINELLARLRAVLRRPLQYKDESVRAGDVRLDPTSRVVSMGGVEINLKPLEFSVLEFFMKNPRQVITTEALLKHVWDSAEPLSADSVYTCMNRLRKRLGQSGDDTMIKTIHGIGYRFDP
jgi:DNA-binding response OmpR family regulator